MFKKFLVRGKFTVAAIILATVGVATNASAMEGSWFGLGASYENLSSGFTENGFSGTLEGGYWYLGNQAIGGSVKFSNFGTANGISGTDLKIIDMGVFWMPATEEGLYGKLITGVAFVNLDGAAPAFRLGDGKSWYFGLGGGFSFPITERLKAGPEVLYRHLTAGDGGDQVSVGGLITLNF